MAVSEESFEKLGRIGFEAAHSEYREISFTRYWEGLPDIERSAWIAAAKAIVEAAQDLDDDQWRHMED